MKAEEKLWKNRANKILQRNELDEASNLEDTDSPDGNGDTVNDIHNRNDIDDRHSMVRSI